VASKTGGSAGIDGRVRLRSLLADRLFAALLVADSQSTIGDQVARVALSVLVFERTKSAGATALTYAATFVPSIVGGLAFAGAGDRFRRGPVMVAVSLVRAALFAVMAASAAHLAFVVVLLVVAVLLGPVCRAAETAFLTDALGQHEFAAGVGIRLSANQLSQVLGFALGGVVVAALGPRPALIVNAATFVVAAVLLGWAARGERRRSIGSPQATAGLRTATAWFGRRPLMVALLGLSALDGLFFVPEGLAVPFGHQVGTGPLGAGLLLAALPLGSALGAAVLVRFVPYRARPLAARWMAACCGLPLLLTAIAPPWPVAFGCWALTGALSAFQVVAITTVAQAAPDSVRARILGFGSAVVLAAQGIGLAVFGGVAQFTTPAASIAVAGIAGCALACCLAARPLVNWTGEVTRA
jgi:hypothetical protein